MISENNKRDSTTKMCMHKLLSAVGFPLYTPFGRAYGKYTKHTDLLAN